MTSELLSESQNNKFNLEERTSIFAENIIEFSKRIRETPIARPLISQLVRAGTSVGANYCEANDAESKKDFIHKLGISRKEAKETMYWLRLIVKAQVDLAEAARPLWQEAKELNLIFSAAIRTGRANLQ